MWQILINGLIIKDKQVLGVYLLNTVVILNEVKRSEGSACKAA